MYKEKLIQFLLSSNKAGYAGGDSNKWVKESDGSTTITFEQGKWKSHDNFFGGEPYGGRSVVSYDKKPVWIMVYYGWVTESVDANRVYEVLRNALTRMPRSAPYRGPKRYQQDQFVYTNKWNGTVSAFTGEEKITQGVRLVYKADYMGGEIDKRAGV